MRNVLAIALAGVATWAASPASADARCADSQLVTQRRAVGGFREIGLSAPAEVIVKQGARESLVVRAPANVLPHLVTAVDGSRLELKLDDDGPHQIDCQIIFEITVVTLTELDVSGAGKVSMGALTGKNLKIALSGAASVTMDSVSVGQLALSMSGAAKVKANGQVTHQKVSISGTGQYKGEQLGSQSASVTISGTGSAQLNVAKELNATISGVGNVAYIGNPRVTQQISGVGKVRPLRP